MRSVIILLLATILTGCSGYTYVRSDVIPQEALQPIASGACEASKSVTRTINDVVIPNREVELRAESHVYTTPEGFVEKGYDCSNTAITHVPAQPRVIYSPRRHRR